jgi:pyruvate-formate lyase-activating enzyme
VRALDPSLRFRDGAFRHCVTLRCDHACPSCEVCRSVEPPGGWDRAPAGDPGTDPRVILLHGGDPLRHGDLDAWCRWARGNPRAWVEVEAPANALGDARRDEALARIRAAAPDGLRVVLPTVDPAQTEALTGRSWDPRAALDALRALDGEIAVAVVFPCNAATVRELHEVVRACAEVLGARAEVILRRAPLRAAKGRLPVLGEPGAWAELEDLSAQLALLPQTLPGGARLRMDPDAGYALCMLDPRARRADLTTARTGPPRAAAPLDARCDDCAWRARCAWALRGAVAPAVVAPLTEADVLALQSQATQRDVSHRPHAEGVRADRGRLGIPDLLCVAPWTSLSITESILHPVPCAVSWIDNAVAARDAAEVLGVEVAEVHALEARAKNRGLHSWFTFDNEDVSLEALWNSPLLRRMRRQMRGGGPSRHCRSMCRVILGVEDRGAELLLRRDADLPDEARENRRRLLEELREGRDVLTARPLDLIIGVASHCNITCGFCHGPKGLYGELTDRRRDEVQAWLPTLLSIGVSGPGEPLMSRNFLTLLGHMAERRYPALGVSLTTNGTLLTPSFLARHAGVRWSHVRVSLNAGSADTHARMTGRRLFDAVRRNLDALCALRDRATPPFDVTLSCVLSELVIGDLDAFARLVTDYRTEVVVEPMYGDLEGLSPWVRPARLAVLADELGAVAARYAVENPPLARAFEAVHQFARARLGGTDFSPLKHH